MNLHNLRRNAILLEQLAAAYVLGTLRGGARRRFDSWLAQAPEVQHTVYAWQDRLAPLAELAPSAAPSSLVWQRIEHQLGLRSLAQDNAISSKSAAAPQRRGFWSLWGDNLRFWRGLGFAASALATVLMALLLTQQLGSPTAVTSYVALLNDSSAQTVAVVTGDAKRHQMTVKVVAHQVLTAQQSLELWAVPATGAPRSLGLIAADGSITLPLPANAGPGSIPLLAVTLEPKGGSPNPNGPTGPIVFKGAWVQI